LPGRWVVTVEGPRGRSERTVDLTKRASVDLTLHAARRSPPALLSLTNLDERFDGPLWVRLERENEDPLEFVADPARGSTQTFSVKSGTSRLVVYPLPEDGSEPGVGADVVPIKETTIEIPAGETHVVALYPR
jgi:hypothetical protein